MSSPLAFTSAKSEAYNRPVAVKTTSSAPNVKHRFHEHPVVFIFVPSELHAKDMSDLSIACRRKLTSASEITSGGKKRTVGPVEREVFTPCLAISS